MNLHDIKAFVALAETGSINRAALRLNLTQPATSRRVQNFEAAMGGAPLLDRRVKPPTLTPLGKQVLEQCRHVLGAVAGLADSVAGSTEPAGDLRIGIAHGLADVVLAFPLDDLRRRFPRVRLQISSNWTTPLIEETRSGALDCAVGLLTTAHIVPPTVVAATLGPEQIVVVAARGSALGRKRKGGLRLHHLAEQSWVLNPPGCGCRAVLQRAFDRDGAPMRVAAEIFGEDLQLSLIARSDGLGFVPRRRLEHSVFQHQLRIVPVANFALDVRIAMLRGPSLGNLTAAVDKLQADIICHLAETTNTA